MRNDEEKRELDFFQEKLHFRVGPIKRHFRLQSTPFLDRRPATWALVLKSSKILRRGVHH